MKFTLLLPRKDYNEEWFPINDPAWHDKSGQPYGRVPAALDWISYDVRTRLSCPACAIPTCPLTLVLSYRVACVESETKLLCAQFYRLNNVSWLQPMCEYPQNLYTRMAPHHRAVLL